MNTTNHQFSTKKKDSIKVCIRLRPLLAHEDIEYWDIDSDNRTLTSKDSVNNEESAMGKLLMDSIYSRQQFQFDKVYSKEDNSQKIYKEMCRDITKNFINGINGSIFTYGQTTSGKTFTMLGSPQNPGILPCVLKDLFDLLKNSNNVFDENESNENKTKDTDINNYKVYCTYVEIYNENIHDLLTDATSLKLVDDNKFGVVVSGAQKIQIKNFVDGIKIKDFGEEKRKYKDTVLNEYSSRSHTVFQIFLENVFYDEEINAVTSRYSIMNLIDLAGSEKIHEAETSSGETGYINKSLFCLTNVINKLAEGKKNKHIPYRDSKLTRLLSVALGGNSLITIICNISPSAINFFQTLSTLRFASRAKIVSLKPGVNEFIDEKEMIEMYKNELLKLKGNATILEDIEEDLDESNIQNNNKTGQDYKLLYFHEALDNKKLKVENAKLSKDLEKSLLRLSYVSEGANNNPNKDYMFLAPYIEQLNSSIKMKYSKTDNFYSYFTSQIAQIKNEYENQLNSLQQFYLKKVKEIQSQIENTDSDINITHNNSNSNHSNNNKDIVISPLNIDNFVENVTNQTLFDLMSSEFNTNSDVKATKEEYENKVDLLENAYLKYKSFLENYFQTIYSQISTNTNIEAKNKSIKNLKDDFDDLNKGLNELYEIKQADLEKNFFDILRKITKIQRNNNNS